MNVIEFQFDSFAEFLNMAGHGPYVWACYIITALALAYLAITPVLKRRALFAELARQSRIEKHLAQKAKQ
ncbi:MAG: heme exporter protein CcmD [Cellvibrionaceae bacterium]